MERRRRSADFEGEEGAKPLAKCEDKRKEWEKHWQCDTKVRDLKDKQWRNDEFKNLVGDMRGWKRAILRRQREITRQRQEYDVKAFTAKFRWTCQKETRGEVVEFLEKVEECGRWP